MFTALRYAVLFSLIAVTAVTGATNKPAPAAGKTPTMVQIVIDGKVADEKATVIGGQAYVPISMLAKLQGKAVRYDAAKKRVVVGTETEAANASDVKPVLEVTMGDPEYKIHIEAMGLSARSETYIPEKLQFYSCIILNNDNAVKPEDADRLKTFVANGGGLVLMGATPLRLTGQEYSGQDFGEQENLKSIVDWFGCSQLFSVQNRSVLSDGWSGVPATISTWGSNPLGTSLSKNAILFTYRGDAAYAMAGSPDKFCEFQAMWQCENKKVSTLYAAAFLHPYGKGRVYWQSVINDASYPKLWELCRAGIYRAATGHNIKAK